MAKREKTSVECPYGFVQGTSTRQTGVVGPRVTTP
jgi:hypothetical protein